MMEFVLKKIDSRCCGANVRTGTFIILWLCLAYYCYAALEMISYGDMVYSALNSLPEDSQYPSAITLVVFQIIFWGSLICMIVLEILPSILALYGTFKSKPRFLEPYIFVNMTQLLTNIVSFVILGFALLVVAVNETRLEEEIRKILKNDSGSTERPSEFHYYYQKDEYSASAIISIVEIVLGIAMVVTAVCIGLLYVFTSVVHSHHMKLKAEEEDQKNNKYYPPGCIDSASFAPPAYTPLDEFKNV